MRLVRDALPHLAAAQGIIGCRQKAYLPGEESPLTQNGSQNDRAAY